MTRTLATPRALATLALALLLAVLVPGALAEAPAAEPGTATAPAVATGPAAPALDAQASPASAGTAPVVFVGQQAFDRMCRAEQAGTLAELAETRLFLSSGTCYDTYNQCQAECQCGGGYDPFECRKICAAGCCTCVCP